MEIKLNIQNYGDRERIVLALANSGINVRVQEKKNLQKLSNSYYVIFEYNQTEKEK
jgi:hypothetical protein